MSEVTGEVHDRSRPFTGAVFDTLVDTFQSLLVEQGLADERLLQVDIRELDADTLDHLNAFTASAFRARPLLFKTALIEARDQIGRTLVRAWNRLDPDDLHYDDAAQQLIDAGGAFPGLAKRFEVNIAWREII